MIKIKHWRGVNIYLNKKNRIGKKTKAKIKKTFRINIEKKKKLLKWKEQRISYIIKKCNHKQHNQNIHIIKKRE